MVNEASLFYAKLATVAIAFAGKALFRQQAFANIKLLRLSPLAIFDPLVSGGIGHSWYCRIYVQFLNLIFQLIIWV